MKTMKKLLLLSVTVFGLSGLTFAQDLIVTLTNGNTETFSVSNIQSIKFGAEEMMLYEMNGTLNSWSIEDINKYAFDGVANVDESVNISTDELSIYPNPSSGNVTINYTSNVAGDISISIFDMNGRLVKEVYRGEHSDETEKIWNAKENSSVQSGKYLCKIATQSKVITKSIVIQ